VGESGRRDQGESDCMKDREEELQRKALDQLADKILHILAKRKARAKKSTAFNSRLFEATYGKLTRGVDSFARHCDITNSNAHRHLNRLLKDFWEAWEKVVEETKEKVTV
jgi:hypothetical protein